MAAAAVDSPTLLKKSLETVRQWQNPPIDKDRYRNEDDDTSYGTIQGVEDKGVKQEQGDENENCNYLRPFHERTLICSLLDFSDGQWVADSLNKVRCFFDLFTLTI